MFLNIIPRLLTGVWVGVAALYIAIPINKQVIALMGLNVAAVCFAPVLEEALKRFMLRTPAQRFISGLVFGLVEAVVCYPNTWAVRLFTTVLMHGVATAQRQWWKAVVLHAGLNAFVQIDSVPMPALLIAYIGIVFLFAFQSGERVQPSAAHIP